jgi:hypothetical protein
VKKKLSEEAREYFRQEGAKGGKIGGKRRLEKLSPEKRSEIAKKASEARWGKKK